MDQAKKPKPKIELPEGLQEAAGDFAHACYGRPNITADVFDFDRLTELMAKFHVSRTVTRAEWDPATTARYKRLQAKSGLGAEALELAIKAYEQYHQGEHHWGDLNPMMRDFWVQIVEATLRVQQSAEYQLAKKMGQLVDHAAATMTDEEFKAAERQAREILDNLHLRRKPTCGNNLCRVDRWTGKTVHAIVCPERGPGWA